MWQVTHHAVFPGLSRDDVWAAWSDIDHWHDWDTDIEYAKAPEGFREGSVFTLKPKGGPRVRITLLRAEPRVGYTDLTHFPLARMFGIHDMADVPGGLRLTITIRVEGLLGGLWRKLVAQKVADEAPAQMRALATYAMQRAARAAQIA